MAFQSQRSVNPKLQVLALAAAEMRTSFISFSQRTLLLGSY
jgi:hypothetical protein